MSSDSFMSLFDMIILFYGAYMIYSGYQMRKTHEPSKLIITQSDLIGARDPKGFCEAMFKPFVIFGMLAILYGIVGFLNDRFVEDPMVNLAAIGLFLILCFWFMRELNKNKTKYLK